MPSTYSDRLRLELIATGERNGTWGTATNTNLGTLLEDSIAGFVTITHDNTANYSLTTANGAVDEARNMVINVTGALTAARNVVVPTKEKIYIVDNNTSGGFHIVVKTSGGAGVYIPNGKKSWLYCNGTDVLEGINALSSNTILYDGTDSTKRAQFVLSGLTTATTRSFTLPDASVTLAGLPDVQSRVAGWAAGAGTVNAITAAFTPAVTAVTDGMQLVVRASGANTSITPTFSPDGLTARTIVKQGGLALNIGDIRAAGHELQLVYRASSTRWELLNPRWPNGFAMKIAGETVNNSTTLQNDDHLFFAVAANTDYEFEFSIFLDTPTTAALKATLTGPASPTLLNVLVEDVVDSTMTVSIQNAFSFSHTVTPAILTRAYARYTGILRNGANAGTVQLQWAQNSAVASDTTVRAGSFVRYNIVA